MIRPKQNKVVHWFFHRYFIGLVKGAFHAVNFNRIETDPQRSVLLIANHYSWWDGFLLYYLNAKVFQRKFHMMVLEDTVKKYWFVKYFGVYSVNKGSPSVIESLDFTAELLKDPANLVVIFPQGKLYSNFVDRVCFEKGINKVAGEASNFQFVFAVSFIEYLQHKKPTANVYLKIADENFTDINNVTAAFQQHYNAAKQEQTKIVL